MSERQISTISFLTLEETESFVKELNNQFENYRYFDLKIDPKLKPARHSGENSFEWVCDWDCEIGSPTGERIYKKDLLESQVSLLSPYIKSLGWSLVQEIKSKFPIPWDGCSLSLSDYSGHPSWEYVDKHPKRQGFSFSWTMGERCPRMIVGMIQVKDADLLIGRVIENVLEMVDWLVIIDNNSSDNTSSQIEKLAKNYDKIIFKKILTVEGGGRLLNSLCGTDTAVIKIDADEVWNPSYGKELRRELKLTNFSSQHIALIKDGWFHVNGLDLNNKVCVGKQQDMSLYYFGNILAWSQPTERLHGRPMTLRNHCDLKNRHILVSQPREMSASILHFPFLDLCSLKRKDFRPGIESHKGTYVEKDSSKWRISYLKEFNLEKELREILDSEVWSVRDTHSYLF